MKGYVYKIILKNKEDILYIGSTIDINRRFNQHKRNSIKGGNNKLYNYLHSNNLTEDIELLVLEEIIFDDRIDLFKKENEYIKKFKPSYNDKNAPKNHIKCVHNIHSYFCRECEGGGICEHDRARHTCIECNSDRLLKKCNICNITIRGDQMQRHLRNLKHQRNLEKVNIL